MLIVDAQVHVWSANSPARPWPAGRDAYAHGPALNGDEVLRVMDDNGVARTVLVPPSWIGDDNTDAVAAARAHPDRFAAMGRLDVKAPDAKARVARWLEQPGMLGIRLTLHRPPWKDWLAEGTLDWFWAAAEQAGIPLMILVPGQVPAVGPIAARHPRLRLILDHLARRVTGQRSADETFADIDEVLALARYPNVAAKVTSLPCFSTEPYPYRDLHKHVRRVYDAFGARRMLWGTDYSRLRGSYGAAIRLFTEALDFLGKDDLEWIMGKAACEWVGWPA